MNIVTRQLGRWAELLRKRANMNATIRELHMLSDAELKDVGIERGQIEEVARSIIDFHRAVRDKCKYCTSETCTCEGASASVEN